MRVEGSEAMRKCAGERKLSPAAAAMLQGHDRLISMLGVIAALILLALPVLITLDVAGRVLRIGSMKWVIDVSEYLMFFATFLGAPWLMRLGLHVRVDVLLTALPRRAARKLEQALDLFCISICVTLAYYGFLAAMDAYRLGMKQYKALTVPDWPFHALFAFTMVLLAVEFIRRLQRPDAALEHDPTVGI